VKVPVLRAPRRRDLHLAAPLAIAAPALAQVLLLLFTMLARLRYPYDLEWMEGGVLVHAHRLAHGEGIYVAPSLDFIPYLYPPLYPGLLAALSPIFGLSYQVARTISILSTLATIGFAFAALVPRVDPADRRLATLGGAVAAGLFAATYPWVDGWYDIARGDSLFLAMVIGGLVATAAWARAGRGWTGHGRIALAAAILALSFFCKQTGVFFVIAGGAVVVVMNWRRAFTFGGVAALIGLGGTKILDVSTDDRFWTYALEVHQTHDCNSDRFWGAFGTMLWKFPSMTVVIIGGLVAVAAAAITRRRLPRSATPLLVWSWVFVVAILVGAVGIATQWSHNNAFIPAMATGAIAAGAALPALAGALTALFGGRAPTPPPAERTPWYRSGVDAQRLAVALPLVGALGLATQLVFDWWSPARLVPTAQDRARGDRLIAQIRAIDGDVFVPFHPWYGHLAGKPVFTHRMGVLDMRYQPPSNAQHQCFFRDPKGHHNWEVAGIPDDFRNRRFAAVFWDNRGKEYFDGLTQSYRLDDKLPGNARPRLFTGATDLVPDEIWVPRVRPDPPAGAHVLFDFENGSFAGWNHVGDAWGDGPESAPLTAFKQGAVRRYGGRYFATSMHKGDQAAGILTSPTFTIDGPRITMLIGGGVEGDAIRELERAPGEQPWLRVELWIDGETKSARHASPAAPPSERLQRVEWQVPEYLGRKAQLVLVDASSDSWGHLDVDEIWIWDH